MQEVAEEEHGGGRPSLVACFCDAAEDVVNCDDDEGGNGEGDRGKHDQKRSTWRATEEKGDGVLGFRILDIIINEKLVAC